MEAKRHHVVCIPAPHQGHINPMFKLAKLLHSKGFYITFIHTEFNYGRLDSTHLHALEDFHFETIPDGLPRENKRGVNDLLALCQALAGLEPTKGLRDVLLKLEASSIVPPISCIIADTYMSFVYRLCKEMDIRTFLFYTPSACAVLGYLHFDQLVKRGLFPIKDENNGFLETPMDWIPGLKDGVKMKHIPSFKRRPKAHEMMFNFNLVSATHAISSGSIILNTFDDLEGDVLEGIKTKIPNVYTIGPLALLCKQSNVQNVGLNLRKAHTNCLSWLDDRGPKSVIYVNYGSLATLTSSQLEEFAWGLANSKQQFLWVIRNDLVSDGSSVLSEKYMEEIKTRGLVLNWCDQERVLQHPSIGVFLNHCGWNSTLESIGEGIPMICWPFFSDQQMNCFYACDDWRVGVDIGEGDVTREKFEKVLIEMMEGEKGKKYRKMCLEWKKKAEEATRPGGSSHNNFENLVKKIMQKT